MVEMFNMTRNELIAKVNKTNEQNAALLDVVIFLDTAIEPQSRTYDEYGYCKIHQEILQDFQARIENALAKVGE